MICYPCLPLLAEAALDFENKSVSLQNFSPLANSALLDFSLFLCSPLCGLIPRFKFVFASQISVNSQFPISNFQQPRKHAPLDSVLKFPEGIDSFLTFANK